MFQDSNWNHDELESYNPCFRTLNWNHDELDPYVQDLFES